MENKDGKRSKMTRDSERDVSERIALGQAVPKSTETLFDQRLFNQVRVRVRLGLGLGLSLTLSLTLTPTRAARG